mmetsp:Transcript_100/g.319  ORF Transcript_100/g.319 Transcript_100/m.319 type:complete len:435 (+) Transcript_100:338-1642(+)
MLRDFRSTTRAAIQEPCDLDQYLTASPGEYSVALLRGAPFSGRALQLPVVEEVAPPAEQEAAGLLGVAAAAFLRARAGSSAAGRGLAGTWASTRALTFWSSSSSSIGAASSDRARSASGQSLSSSDTSGIWPRQLGAMPHAVVGSAAEAGWSPASPFTRASASRIQGESCPSASGEATPELMIDASADAEAEVRDFPPTKFGVSTPKPGVPEVLATAAPGPSFWLSLILVPCSLMESRWSCMRSSTQRPLGFHASRDLVVVVRSRAPTLWREATNSCSHVSCGSSLRGVGCGEVTGVGSGLGAFGYRTCCSALIRSSFLMRHEFRPHRAHVSNIRRVAMVTGTSGHSSLVRALLAPQLSDTAGGSSPLVSDSAPTPRASNATSRCSAAAGASPPSRASNAAATCGATPGALPPASASMAAAMRGVEPAAARARG